MDYKRTHNELKMTAMRNAAIFAGSLLTTVLAFYAYSPVFGSHAEGSASTSTEVNVSIDPVISLAASSDAIDMDASINSFVHKSVDLTVITNSQFGYALTIEDADANTNMVHENSAIKDVIVSNFTGAKTNKTLGDNTWGYSVDNGSNYYRIPALGNANLIDNYAGIVPNGTATKTVDFGIKAGMLTSGTYSDVVLFTAYTNGYGNIPTLDAGLTPKGVNVAGTMQDFKCSSLKANQIVYLKDTRDNKAYRVGKVADGKCWMLESLSIYNNNLTSAASSLPATVDGKAYSFDLSEIPNIYNMGRNIREIYNNNPGKSQSELDALFTNHMMYASNEYGVYYAPITAFGGIPSFTASMMQGTGAIEYSICPKSWKIPTSAEALALAEAYKGEPEKIIGEPGNLKFAGIYTLDAEGYARGEYNVSFTGEGQFGHFLLSDVSIKNDAPSVQVVHYQEDGFSLEEASDFSLYSIRCVAR